MLSARRWHCGYQRSVSAKPANSPLLSRRPQRRTPAEFIIGAKCVTFSGSRRRCCCRRLDGLRRVDARDHQLIQVVCTPIELQEVNSNTVDLSTDDCAEEVGSDCNLETATINT